MKPQIITPQCVWVFHCPPFPDMQEQRRAGTRTGRAAAWLHRPDGVGMHRFDVRGFAARLAVTERTGA